MLRAAASGAEAHTSSYTSTSWFIPVRGWGPEDRRISFMKWAWIIHCHPQLKMPLNNRCGLIYRILLRTYFTKQMLEEKHIKTQDSKDLLQIKQDTYGQCLNPVPPAWPKAETPLVKNILSLFKTRQVRHSTLYSLWCFRLVGEIMRKAESFSK